MSDFSYDSPEWRAFAARIVERDSSRCVLRRFAGGACHHVLHVHHVEPVDERPDLAFDEENCVTVCATHHPMLEAFRRLVRRAGRRELPRCPHRHPTVEGRRACERKRARALGLLEPEQLQIAA